MPRVRRLPLAAALMLSAAALVPSALAQETGAVDLFAAERPNRAGLPTDAADLGLLPDAVGAIEVFSLSVDAGSGLRSGGPDSQRLRIALPDGGDVTCEVTRAAPVNGVEVIEGSVAGNPLDRCALFVKDGEVTGDIAVGSGALPRRAARRQRPCGGRGPHRRHVGGRKRCARRRRESRAGASGASGPSRFATSPARATAAPSTSSSSTRPRAARAGRTWTCSSPNR